MTNAPHRHLRIRWTTLDNDIAYFHDLGITVIAVCAPSDRSNGCTGHSKAHSPCSNPGKVPLAQGFQHYSGKTRLPLDVVLRQHGEALRKYKQVNEAIVVLNTHIVIEADSEDADREVESYLLQNNITTPTRAARPTRGRLWIFRLPVGFTRRLKSSQHLGVSRAIDAVTGGGIAVIPGSTHKSGHEYQWVPGLAPWDVAIAEIPAELLQLVVADNDRREEKALVDLGLDVDVDGIEGVSFDGTQSVVGENAKNVDGTKERSDDTGAWSSSVAGNFVSNLTGISNMNAANNALITADSPAISASRKTTTPQCRPISPSTTTPTSTATTTTPSTIAPNANAAPTPSILHQLHSKLRRVATEGFVPGMSFASRSEMRFAIALGCMFGGASNQEIARLLVNIPNVFRMDDNRPRGYVIGRDILAAESAYDDQIAAAVPVRFFSAFVSRTKRWEPELAEIRITLNLRPFDQKLPKIEYTIPLVLGEPNSGEFSGEWLEVLRALPDEKLLLRAEELLALQERSPSFKHGVIPGQRSYALYVPGNGATGRGAHLVPFTLPSTTSP